MENKQYLNVSFKADSYKEDDEYFYVKGYASTFNNVDLGNDIVVPGAFVNSLQKQMPKMIYQHNMADPIGVWTVAKEDDRGLYVEGKLPKANSKCKDIFALMKCGAIDSMSIGYTVAPGDFTIKGDNRYLDKVTLWEISLVTLPMNPKAKITSVKHEEQGKTMSKRARDDEEDKKKKPKRGSSQSDDSDDDDEEDNEEDAKRKKRAAKDDDEEFDEVDDEEEDDKRGKRKKFFLGDVEGISTKTELEENLREAGYSRQASRYIAGRFIEKRSESVKGMSGIRSEVKRFNDLINKI